MEICTTCKIVKQLFGTTEYVTEWNCSCKKPKSGSISEQSMFSAGKYVGTKFTKSWQGAPKGRKILFRPSKRT